MKTTTKKKVKITNQEPRKSWVQVQSDYKRKDFDEKAKELVWQLTEGGGSANIHVLTTIRELEWAYLACAAYGMAARDMSA